MKIEKNIPIPPRKNKELHIIRNMEIGDSILSDMEYSRWNMAKFSSWARNFANKSTDCKHYKFTCRKVDGNKMRLWRIK